jgi:hypothetical protein
MGDTGWCPRCGSEFQPGFTTCPDCGVVLSAEPPAPRHAPSLAGFEGHEPVSYDLQDWSEANRESLEWMLAGLEIPFEWDPPGVLTVPEGRADEVEGFIDYLDAGADGDAISAGGTGGLIREADWAEAPVGDEMSEVLGDGETSTEATEAASVAELVAPLRWLEPRLDELQKAYLVERSDHDPQTAFEHALAATLDGDSRARLTSVFDGDEDDVYGAGFGERELHRMRDGLERLAWTIPE